MRIRLHCHAHKCWYLKFPGWVRLCKSIADLPSFAISALDRVKTSFLDLTAKVP